MSLRTTLTRAWLTRSTKTFLFKNEYDEFLPFEECERLGLYVHIPFCKSICAFCPYCKTVYNKDLCDKYIDALVKEIHKVGSQYKCKKETTSLYFGGGTPALIADRIGEIIKAIQEHFVVTEGIGVELHPDNVNVETLQRLKEAGVTKLSIGIQSFQEKYQNILGRKKVDADKLKEALSTVDFETVSMDFIFALPDQTYEDIKADVDTAFKSGANHVAIYPFIDFSFTKSKVKTMPKKQKKELLDRRFTPRQRMVYYLFWTLYSMQLDEKKFEQFFGVPLKKMYGFDFWLAQKLGFLTKENGVYSTTMKGAFYYHYYEQFYTLSYIDKMWGIMRKEAFPERIEF